MATEATDQRRRRKAFPQVRDPGPAPADGPDPQTKAPRPPSPGGVPRGQSRARCVCAQLQGLDPRLGDLAAAPARSARPPGGHGGRTWFTVSCWAGSSDTIQAYRARRHDLGLAERSRPNPSVRSRIKKEPGDSWTTKRAAKRSAEATTIDDSGRFNCAQPIGYAAARPCR